jgi:hypothetical protein
LLFFHASLSVKYYRNNKYRTYMPTTIVGVVVVIIVVVLPEQ